MNSYFLHLGSGILVGLTAGLSPGPLLALMIRETLRSGTRSGMKVAMAPLISDIPIILLSLLFSGFLTQYRNYLSIISLMGGLFLFYLAWQTITGEVTSYEKGQEGNGSLGNAVLVNFLNPAPYLFWLTLGVPTLILLWGQNFWFPVLYVTGFYSCLVGSKLFLAWLIGSKQKKINPGIIRLINRVLGLFLFLYGVKLLSDLVKSLT